jgi:hypothetical protein
MTTNSSTIQQQPPQQQQQQQSQQSTSVNPQQRQLARKKSSRRKVNASPSPSQQCNPSLRINCIFIAYIYINIYCSLSESIANAVRVDVRHHVVGVDLDRDAARTIDDDDDECSIIEQQRRIGVVGRRCRIRCEWYCGNDVSNPDVVPHCQRSFHTFESDSGFCVGLHVRISRQRWRRR